MEAACSHSCRGNENKTPPASIIAIFIVACVFPAGLGDFDAPRLSNKSRRQELPSPTLSFAATVRFAFRMHGALLGTDVVPASIRYSDGCLIPTCQTSSQESIARLRRHFDSSHPGSNFALGIGLCQTYPPRSLPWQLPIAWPIWRSSRTWTTSCKSPSPWLRNCRIRESLKLSRSSPSRSDRRPPRRPTRKLPRTPRSRMRQKQPRLQCRRTPMRPVPPILRKPNLHHGGKCTVLLKAATKTN